MVSNDMGRGACVADALSRTLVRSSLCAQLASVHGERGCAAEAVACLIGRTLSKDCTAAANPNGASGREWCYVEVSEIVATFAAVDATMWGHGLRGAGGKRRASEVGLLRAQSRLC